MELVWQLNKSWMCTWKCEWFLTSWHVVKKHVHASLVWDFLLHISFSWLVTGPEYPVSHTGFVSEQIQWGCSSVEHWTDRRWYMFYALVQHGIFLSESTFSADSVTCVCTPQCATACINIRVHVKDPVVHVRVWWIMDTLKTPSMHSRLDSLTLLQLAFPRESNLNFTWEKSHWDNTVVKSKKKGKKL